jgi:hypothetical protein
MVFIRNLVGGLLAEMEDNIDHDRFKRLLHYSRRLSGFKNRAQLVRPSTMSLFVIFFMNPVLGRKSP